MVSLAAIATVVQSLWPDCNHVVVALPDPRKGEQLVLIIDKPDADRDALLCHAREHGFPELWVPKAILVASIPVLGSDKTDYTGCGQGSDSGRGNKAGLAALPCQALA